MKHKLSRAKIILRLALVVPLTAMAAVAGLRSPAPASANVTVQACLDTLQCGIPDFDTWTMDQRLQFVEALENGYAQEFQPGFNKWGAIEGIIEFFIARQRGAPGSWASVVDAGIVMGIERGLAMALGTDSRGDMGNPGADLWEQYLAKLLAGQLTDPATHDYTWSVAEQASTDYGKCVAENQCTTIEGTKYNTSPLDNLEKTWYLGTQAGRWLLRNYGPLVNVLNNVTQDPNNPYTTAIYALSDVTNPKQWFLYASGIWFGSGLYNLPTDAVNFINDPLGPSDNPGGNFTTIKNDFDALIHPCGQCTGGGQTPPPAYSIRDISGGGAFRSEWSLVTGGETGYLGEPVNNYYSVPGGQEQDFTGGASYYTSSIGTVSVAGSIYSAYHGIGGISSHLGFPTADRYSYNGGTRQDFQHGYILSGGANVGGVYYAGPFSSSPLIVRSNANGLYVSAELGYTGASYAMLRARASSKGSQETWNEIPLDNGMIALQSAANGDFVSAELGYTGSDYAELRARATAVGPYEEFVMVTNADGTYSLRSVANGLYVSAELGYSGANYGELRARAGSIGSWEEFDNFNGGPSCTNYGALAEGPNSCDGGFSTHSVWYSGHGTGLYGQEIWTYANGTTADSTATYQLSGMDTSHVWQLQAYIPNNYSNASHAHYHYCSLGGGCADGYVNQNNYTNQWAVFGAVCTADGTATVVLADDGGDVYPAIVGADAIRAVRLSYLC